MHHTTYRSLLLAGGAAVLLAAATPSIALDLPETGQTTAYTANKNDGITPAVAVPDDGLLRFGPALSYVDNGDGTITDVNTGLMWEKKGDDGGRHDKDLGYPWSGNGAQETLWDWLDDINAEGGTGFAGYSDWRLPNAKELATLVNFQNAVPMTSTPFHTNCAPGVSVLTGSCTVSTNYWTSTTWANSTGMAWGVSFYEGLLGVFDKASGLRMRAVRGGTSGPGGFSATGQTISYGANKNDGIAGAVAVADDGALRAGAALAFVDNGNGTVTDQNTGLVWEKKGDDSSRHDKDNGYWWSGNGVEETIWDWLDDVNAEHWGGVSDWRIPNLRELLSIADFSSTTGIAAIFRTNCVAGVSPITGSCTFPSLYWTSTTRASAPFSAWYVAQGSAYPSFKSGTARVRAVRGGAQ